MQRDTVELLEKYGVQPSAQRLAVADYVLYTDEHPSADQVWTKVRENFPVISRATVYNTLHLFAEKGLIQKLVLAEGRVVFDPKVEPHHHFLDEESGAIHDIPWTALDVQRVENLRGYEVRDYQVVLRGRKTKAQRRE